MERGLLLLLFLLIFGICRGQVLQDIVSILTIYILGKIFCREQIEIFFLFFPEKQD